MTSKVRIVERTHVNGKKEYTIQRRNWFLLGMWIDVSEGCHDVEIPVSFSSLKEAKSRLCYYDGTKITQKIVG